eukprot:13116088-Alexandrium_andersonii.AAC.1
MRWTSAVVWRVLLSNPWGHDGALGIKLEMGCRRLRGDLFEWFRDSGIPHEKRVSDLTLKMLGHDDHTLDPSELHPGCMLKTKAAETSVLMEWAIDLLAKYRDHVEYFDELRAGGTSLKEFLDIIKAEPLCMSRSAQQRLMDCTLRHLVNAERAQIRMAPKHHMFLEMAHRTVTQSWHARSTARTANLSTPVPLSPNGI